jgi:hypothetical protein
MARSYTLTARIAQVTFSSTGAFVGIAVMDQHGNPIDGLSEHNFTAQCVNEPLAIQVNQAVPLGDPFRGFYNAGISIGNKGSFWFPGSEFIIAFLLHALPQGTVAPEIWGRTLAKLTVIADLT